MGKSESLRVILAAGAVVRRGDRIVVVRRNRYGPELSLPKGKLNRGETFEQAAVREVQEETGCTIRLEDLIQAVDYRVRRGPKVVLFFEAELVNEGVFEPSEEVEAIEWLAVEDALAQLTYPVEQRVVERYLRLMSEREPGA